MPRISCFNTEYQILIKLFFIMLQLLSLYQITSNYDAWLRTPFIN